MHLLDGLLHLDQLVAVDDRVEVDLVGTALEPPLQDVPLVVALRIADADPEQEAVELSLR